MTSNDCEMMTSSSDSDIFSWPPTIGFKFRPTDEHLICHCLRRKVMGMDLEFDIVLDMDVYAHEPWLFHWEDKPYLKPYERYYFVKREKVSGSEKRPKRTLEGDFDGGWWKANTGDKDIKIEGQLVGYKKTLTFFSYKNKKRNRKEAVKTDWIMHEYRLATNTFQEWVLCRIKNNAKSQQQKHGKIEITEEEEEKKEEKDQTQQNSYVNESAFNNMALPGESSTTSDDEFYEYMMDSLTEEGKEEKDQTQQNSYVSESVFNNMALPGDSSTNNMALTGESSTNPDDDEFYNELDGFINWG